MSSQHFSEKSIKRVGLSNAEQRFALDIARGYLNSFLHRREYTFPPMLSHLFGSPKTVDVSLWVNGEFRGSYVSEERPLAEGIIFAARRAARDERYKPLAANELDSLRIQITLATGARTLLTKAAREKNKISYDRGYVLEYQEKRGWFLPLIFNVTRMRTLAELSVRLAAKAGISHELLSDPATHIYTFPVQDFIEGITRDTVHDLCGPMTCIDSTLDLRTAAMAAANSLLNAQEVDGNFVPILNPINGDHTYVDWPRCALTGWTLAEYGCASGDRLYIDAAERTASFIGHYLKDDSFVMPDLALTLAYAGQAALRLDHVETALIYAERIASMEHIIAYHPIVFQQIASFLGTVALVTDWKYVRPAARFAHVAYGDFERARTGSVPVFLASYAELANAFIILYQCIGNESYLLSARDILQWLARYQLTSGAFCVSTHSDEINVRGSGKILEVFSVVKALLDEERITIGFFDDVIERCGAWIATMQYDDRNTFFVRPNLRTQVIGGFRHTYGDPDVWIDSAAHFLLAATRLIYPRSFARSTSLEMGSVYPLADARMIMSDMLVNHTSSHAYFFGKRFALERVTVRCIHALFRFIGRFEHDLGESSLASVENNDRLRNYGYLYHYLIRRGILMDYPFDMLLRYRWFSDVPGFFTSDPQMHSIADISDGRDSSHSYAHGFSSRWDVSIGQAFGEVLERYPYGIYRYAELVRGSVNELLAQRKQILSPGQLAVFSTKQVNHFPARRWNDNSQFHWESVLRISTGESFLVPAQTIYWNYRSASDEPRLRESNTSGLGGGSCFESAALSALYELIERDAFFVYWLKGITPTRIDPETVVDESFQLLYRNTVRRGLIPFFLYAPTESGIPVFFTIIHDPRESGPCYVLGGGCNSDPIRALNRSFEEAWSIYYWSRSIYHGQYGALPQPYNPFITPLPINRRISAWSNHAMKGKLDFFIESPASDFSTVSHNDHPVQFTTRMEELQFVSRSVESIGEGYEVYVHHNNHSILASVGYHAVRVIVPKFVPMYYCEENAPIGSSRINAFGAAHGIADDFINSLPHLFP